MTGIKYLIFVCFCHWAGQVTSENCVDVEKEVFHCLSDDYLEIQCPAGHGIRISFIFIWEAEDTCSLPANNTCWKGQHTHLFPQNCTGEESCKVSLERWRKIYNKLSFCSRVDPRRLRPFLQVKYLCVQRHETISLCSKVKKRASSMVLYSHPEGRTIQRTDCMCNVTGPLNGQLIISPIQILKTADPGRNISYCDQHVLLRDRLYDSDRLIDLCDDKHDSVRHCNYTSPVSITFVNKGSDSQPVRTFFSMGIAVPSNYEFEIECGLEGSSYQGVGKIVVNTTAPGGGSGKTDENTAKTHVSNASISMTTMKGITTDSGTKSTTPMGITSMKGIDSLTTPDDSTTSSIVSSPSAMSSSPSISTSSAVSSSPSISTSSAMSSSPSISTSSAVSSSPSMSTSSAMSSSPSMSTSTATSSSTSISGSTETSSSTQISTTTSSEAKPSTSTENSINVVDPLFRPGDEVKDGAGNNTVDEPISDQQKSIPTNALIAIGTAVGGVLLISIIVAILLRLRPGKRPMFETIEDMTDTRDIVARDSTIDDDNGSGIAMSSPTLQDAFQY